MQFALAALRNPLWALPCSSPNYRVQLSDVSCNDQLGCGFMAETSVKIHNRLLRSYM
jgi:hypothetical protein